MSRISEIERPGLPLRIAYRIGERMFGVVPTPEKVMAHRPSVSWAYHQCPDQRNRGQDGNTTAAMWRSWSVATKAFPSKPASIT